MKCPYCQGDDLKVTDSRNSPDANAIRRRRECLNCLQRFTTFETVEVSLQVNKRDGRIEEFQQSKLINGLEHACRHTSVSREQIMNIAAEITNELLQRHLRVVSTTELGHMAMRALKRLDAIAFIRFACVYQRLKNIDELLQAVKQVQSKDAENKEIHNGLKKGRN